MFNMTILCTVVPGTVQIDKYETRYLQEVWQYCNFEKTSDTYIHAEPTFSAEKISAFRFSVYLHCVHTD
jgi:hypothetical protein